MVKDHICNYQGCGKVFASSKNLKDHYRIHTGEKPFVCEKCDKKFGQYSTLHKHYRVHDKKRPYHCDQEGCGKSFTQVSNLIRHQRVHTGDRPYRCDKCTKTFSSSSNLKQHITIHKKSDERNKFKCDICHKDYLYPSSLRKHKETDHQEMHEDAQKEDSEKININIEEIKKKEEVSPIQNESVSKRTLKFETRSFEDFSDNLRMQEEVQDVAFQNLRRTLKDNLSSHSQDNLNMNIQEPISPNINSIGYYGLERKSALARFSCCAKQSAYVQRQANEGSIYNTNDGKFYPFCGSISGKSFNMNAELDSQTSSIINGFTGREFNRTLPPIPQNFECESRGGYGLLPEGIGGLSDNSNQRFNMYLGGKFDNELEREYRLNAASLPKLNDKCIKDNNESGPSFTFQQEGSSMKSLSIHTGSNKGINAPNQVNSANSQQFIQNLSQINQSNTSAPQFSPIKVINKHVLNTGIQVGLVKSRSHSISSQESKPPDGMTPAFVKKQIANFGRFVTSEHSSNKMISTEELKTDDIKTKIFNQNMQIEEPQELQKPIIFKSKVQNKSISSQNSMIHSIKGHKCVKDMTLNELQILYPDLSELTKIISDSKSCNYACIESGKCPINLMQNIEDIKSKNSKSISELINEI